MEQSSDYAEAEKTAQKVAPEVYLNSRRIGNGSRLRKKTGAKSRVKTTSERLSYVMTSFNAVENQRLTARDSGPSYWTTSFPMGRILRTVEAFA